jgi:hypothetical protein
MTLGELIEESRGKTSSQRVIDAKTAKTETSFTMEGNYRGVPCSEVGTYTTVNKGGVLYGKGQGVVSAKDGQGIVTWTGQGLGKFTSPGKVSFRGSVFLQTPLASEGGKLSGLNNLVGVFEFEADEAGNSSSKTWEWK